jgi:hypothetical protein
MRRNHPHITALLLVCSTLLAPVLTLAALAASAPGAYDRLGDEYGFGDLAGNAAVGAAVRKNDPLAIEAAFPRESYAPGSTATLRFWKSLDDTVTLQVFRVGGSRIRTHGAMEMNGVPVTRPTAIGRVIEGRSTAVPIGSRWPTGLYFVKLTAPKGRVGYAPFVVPPRIAGTSRVAVVMPTKTWQAYNYYDDDRDGYGDTWYATYGHTTARLDRPYLNRGVPPHFRVYDLYFLEWLHRTGKRFDVLSQAELDAARDPAALRRAYDLLIFPGHHEYVTTAEYDAVEAFRDRGGSLIFLSANNFFWRVDVRGDVMTRVAQWRDLGRPESALLGVQYIGNDSGEHRGPWLIRDAEPSRWLFAGARLKGTDRFSNAGIEIDHTTSRSPHGTRVVAEIPNLLGPGMTAQMTWYETRHGSKVFSAGAFTLAGSIRQPTVSRLVDNVLRRIAADAV